MRMLPRTAAAVLGCLGLAPAVPAGEAPAQDPIMEAWIKAATPGAQHQFLTAMAGEWKTVTTHYDNGTAGEPTEGTATFTSVMGGRFLQGTYAGTMWGQPFEGMSLEGYDNISGKYWTTWIDNFGTSLFVSHGEMGDDGKTLEHWGAMPDPMGGADMSMHFVTTREGANQANMKMYMSLPDSGDEMLAMEITFTRASS